MIILFKFKNLHFKLVQTEVVKSVVICLQKISDLVEKEKTSKTAESIFSEDDLNYISRVVSLLVYETSFFTDVYEDILSKPVIKFMVR
mmetsp:Transcript_26496/g.23464  ORF Transcript_26496/g.23464 Transcript_26496/m.23464 type:complete len:88 (-) Transcript_26496:2572-2835(-)